MKKRILTFLIIFFCFICSFFIVDLFLAEKKSKENTIVIGAKNIAENQILAEIMALLIEKNTPLTVRKKYNLEGTFINFQALKSGDIDIYPEYTGTGLVSILQENPISDPEETYFFVKREFEKRFNLIWLQPFGFKNNYALMMLKKKAKKLNIHTIVDLKRCPDLIFGFNPEFVARKEFQLLKDDYHLQFKKSPKIMDHALLYFSLVNESIDVMNGFTTDPEIVRYQIEVLKDVKNSFPYYAAAPLIRKETLQKYPYLEDWINKLANTISDEEMQEMNYQADYLGKSIQKIAREFLEKQQL